MPWSKITPLLYIFCIGRLPFKTCRLLGGSFCKIFLYSDQSIWQLWLNQAAKLLNYEFLRYKWISIFDLETFLCRKKCFQASFCFLHVQKFSRNFLWFYSKHFLCKCHFKNLVSSRQASFTLENIVLAQLVASQYHKKVFRTNFRISKMCLKIFSSHVARKDV